INAFTVPAKPELSLYCIWLGANATFSNAEPDTNVENIKRLYARGARQILIESQFDIAPLSLRYFGTNNSLPREYRLTALHFNEHVMESVNEFARTVPDLRIYYVDMYSLFYGL